MVDVHDHSRAWDDGTVIPWCAVICSAPEAPHYDVAPRLATGDTVAELWAVVHDQLGEIGDEVNMIVGARWSLEGDFEAWRALRNREGLQATPTVALPQSAQTAASSERPRRDAMPQEEPLVEPVPLFHPERGEMPPWEAVDVYLDPPASLSKLWVRASRELPPAESLRLHDAIAEWRAMGMREAIKSLQNESAFVKRGEHAPDPTRRQAVQSSADLQWERSVGYHVRAHLELTAVPHDNISQPGFSGTHWLHEHVYIGTTADALDGSGRWPLDLGALYTTVLTAQAIYGVVLRAASKGVRWESLHHLTGEHEIVEPSLEEELMDRHGADEVCTGLGPVRVCMRPGRLDRNLNPYRRGK